MLQFRNHLSVIGPLVRYWLLKRYQFSRTTMLHIHFSINLYLENQMIRYTHNHHHIRKWLWSGSTLKTLLSFDAIIFFFLLGAWEVAAFHFVRFHTNIWFHCSFFPLLLIFQFQITFIDWKQTQPQFWVLDLISIDQDYLFLSFFWNYLQ